MVSINDALAIAVQHHQSGRLQVAEQIYRQILQIDPNQPEAIHLLGVLACDVGKPEMAVQYIERAIELKGDEASFHVNLADAYWALGRFPEAIACYRRALGLKPNFVEAHYNLGNAFNYQGKLDEAVASYRRALELRPDFGEAYNNLAVTLEKLGKTEEAITCLRRVLENKPNFPDAYNNLGNALRRQQEFREAIACFRRALELKSEYTEAYVNLGNTLYDVDECDEAVACFRRALEIKPDLAEAHNNLGAVLKRQEKLEEAIACHRRALELKPHYADAYNNLGTIYSQQGKRDEAAANFRRALELNPDCAEMLSNVGNSFKDEGQLEKAIACHYKALELKPDFADGHNNLGTALKDQGNLDAAIASYRRALQLKPNFAVAYNNLGDALREQAKFDEAVACHRRALELRPNYVEAYNNLGAALKDQGKLEESFLSYLRAVELKPDYPEAQSNLGIAFADQGKLDQAITCLRRALEIKPDFAKAHNNLGNVLKTQGRLAAAVDCYRQALKLESRADFHSNYLLTLIYDSAVPPDEIYAEHVRWAETFGQSAASWPPPENVPDPDRRLRVGYISGDFRGHAVSCFIEPILQCHDHECFEVFCYANNVQRDDVTQRLQPLPDHWRWISGVRDDALVEVIRNDQIDILVELSGHSALNRLTALARKPAPVQVTYIGYPATTGLAAIDYRFTDEILNPSNEPSYHTEQLYRLPCGSACYIPRMGCPEVAELPAKTRGFLTFGAPHNLGKLNAGVLDLWSRILHSLPTARLVLFRETINGQVAHQLREEFVQRGIAAGRLDLLCDSTSTQGYAGYMSKYHDIDICLDTFPANAGTTCCEALWMGVPWLTRYGDRFFGRQTASVLTRLGLSEWIAHTQDELVEKAVYWSEHWGELAEIRMSLRQRFMDSTIGNAQQFTRGLEAAYRDIWRRWCQRTLDVN